MRAPPLTHIYRGREAREAATGRLRSGSGSLPARFIVGMRFRLTRLLMWMGAAAALTYYLDPVLGERRRKELRKRVERMRKAGRKARLQAGL
jgi:hypothetical protein